MSEEVIDLEAVEEPVAGSGSSGEARIARSDPREIERWRGDVRTVAVAAAGGLAAGAATVAAAGAVKAKTESRGRRGFRLRRRGRDSILTSRSFLIDVHVLRR